VIVMQNSRTDHIDLIPIDWDTTPILEPGGNYAGTNIFPMVRLYYDAASSSGLRSGVHISCNYPGYALVSTHIAPGVAEQNWLDRTNVLIRLDRLRPHVYYLTKIHGACQEEPRAYWEETQGTITSDGRKIVWADNWGLNVGQEQMFLMQLDMPRNWDSFRTPVARWQRYP